MAYVRGSTAEAHLEGGALERFPHVRHTRHVADEVHVRRTDHAHPSLALSSRPLHISCITGQGFLQSVTNAPKRKIWESFGRFANFFSSGILSGTNPQENSRSESGHNRETQSSWESRGRGGKPRYSTFICGISPSSWLDSETSLQPPFHPFA